MISLKGIFTYSSHFSIWPNSSTMFSSVMNILHLYYCFFADAYPMYSELSEWTAAIVPAMMLAFPTEQIQIIYINTLCYVGIMLNGIYL